MQEVKVVARTFEVGNEDNLEKRNSDLKILSGKAAGVCYMPDDYMEEGIQNVEKALARAEQTAKSGHHSVYDHGHITMVIKTNKMMAMILNSLGVYATSEKSARYTKMHPETELEMELYTKWQKKIQGFILNNYPDIDDSMLNTRFKKLFVKKEGTDTVAPLIRNRQFEQTDYEFLKKYNSELDKLKESDTLPSYKLAQENARYMISVFTPTVMEYTISFRQLFLTIDYLSELSINLSHASDNFSKKLSSSVVDLNIALAKVAGEPVLHDGKNQYIRFLEAQHVGEMKSNENKEAHFECYYDLEERLKGKQSYFGDSYTAVYSGSLAMLAQAQRHRTLRYTMRLQEAGEYGFYVPRIVKNANCEDEWLEDIKKVSYCIPQGTMVRITEQGLVEDFVMKCKERMCGRAQLEVMAQTGNLVKDFYNNLSNLSYMNQKLIKGIMIQDERTIGLTPCARCQFKDFSCKEGCQWGSAKALTRLV